MKAVRPDGLPEGTVNPSLAIMAMALRAADHRQGRGLNPVSCSSPAWNARREWSAMSWSRGCNRTVNQCPASAASALTHYAGGRGTAHCRRHPA